VARRNAALKKYDIDVLNKILEPRGLKCKKYGEHIRAKATFECKKGHTWRVAADSVLRVSGCPTCATTVSDNDAIYVWESVGETFNGKPVYKIGITSARLKDCRVKNVAKKSGRDAKIVILQSVKNARALETLLHTFGDDPKFDKFDGSTEFRALSGSELARVLELIRDRPSCA
jgi:hypothetical protein